MRDNLTCKANNFRSLFNKVNYPSDVIEDGGGELTFLTVDEVIKRFGETNSK